MPLSTPRFMLSATISICLLPMILSGCALVPPAAAPPQETARNNGTQGGGQPPVHADLQERTRRFVEAHRDRAKAGFYPDGTRLGVTCLVLTVEACLVEYFLAEQGIGDELDAETFDPERYLVIDVRGETERVKAPLPASLGHRTVQYGFDSYDPLALTGLDREAFADAVIEARGDDPRPVALLCTAGIRSRGALAALHEAGIDDVLNLRGGLAAHPSLVIPPI